MITKKFLNNLQKEYNLGRADYFDSVTSTNDLAASWLNESCPDKSLIIAGQQTQGKGRQGRVWYSPPGASISLSLILKSGLAFSFPQMNAGLSALSVCEALDDLVNQPPTIKWPNDVLIARKKVCGILVESQWEGSKLIGVIIGIGINLNQNSLTMPEPPRFPATSVQEHSDSTIQPELLIGNLISNLVSLNQNLGVELLLEKWNNRLAFKNEMVTGIGIDGLSTSGILKGVYEEGSLIVVSKTGEEIKFQPNEIRILPDEL